MKPKLNLVRGNNGGQPIVFQHGLCGQAAQTHEAFPIDPRFQMLTLECRGHGASEAGPLDAFSIKTFADDVAAMVEVENITPCIIGGISMGAAIALHLAVHKPHLVKALVLARPAWLIENGPENMRPNREVGALLSQFAPNVAKQEFLKSDLAKHLSKTSPDNLVSLTRFFARQPLATTAALLTRIANDGPGVTEAQVRNIKVPTLIIATTQDHIHPFTHAEALHEMIPQSHLAVITPKGIDKTRYVSEFQSTLLKFFEENI
jgi:pimeloyl-ACP methyl ester carboxylesterase